MQTDMTVGKPMKMILDFTIPVFIGNVFQQFYNMADAIIVGKFVGTKGLAAVGSTGTIMFLIIGFLMGLTAGFTVLTSQKFGAGKMDEMRQSVGNAALLSIIISVIMTAVSMVGMHSLLTLMHTPEDIFQDAYTYIMIICGGIFAQVLYNILASILRALGNSKTPLYFLILAALLNIVLDLTFIIVFHMGVAGAAWATITAQGVSGVLCLIYIIKYVPELRLKADDWRFRSEIAKKEILVGIPMGLQYSITAIGTMMVQSALNILGSYAVAAFTAGNKIENIFTQAYVAIGTTMATYNAQNIGARKLDRVSQGFNSAHIIGITYAIVTGVIIFFFGKYLSYLFISDNAAEVIPWSSRRRSGNRLRGACAYPSSRKNALHGCCGLRSAPSCRARDAPNGHIPRRGGTGIPRCQAPENGAARRFSANGTALRPPAAPKGTRTVRRRTRR